jgi:hypothetical protein
MPLNKSDIHKVKRDESNWNRNRSRDNELPNTKYQDHI